MPRQNLISKNGDGNAIPRDTLSTIPPAEDTEELRRTEARERRRKQRRAEYDRNHPITSFFVPAHLKEKAELVKASMAALAHERVSTENSVSLALIQWSLAQVRKGNLNVDYRPAPKRRKLHVIVVETGRDSWATPQEIPDLPKKQGKFKSIRVGWRWPEDVKRQLDGLSSDVLPVGELAIKLLAYALDAYKAGKITIQTEALEIKQEIRVTNETW